MVGYWCRVGSLALTPTHNDVAILVQWRTLFSIFLLFLWLQCILRGSLALPVCAFLDMPDLCSVELAGFNRSASALCWKWWRRRKVDRLTPEDLGTAWRAANVLESLARKQSASRRGWLSTTIFPRVALVSSSSVRTRQCGKRSTWVYTSQDLAATILGSMPELFEDENEVLQATALPQVSPCAQRVEAWLSTSQSGALGFVRRCGVSSVLVTLSLRGHHSKYEHHPVSCKWRGRSQCRACAPRSSTCFKVYQGRTSSRSQDVNIPCALRSSIGSKEYPSCALCSTLQIWPSRQASALCKESWRNEWPLCITGVPMASARLSWRCGSASGWNIHVPRQCVVLFSHHMGVRLRFGHHFFTMSVCGLECCAAWESSARRWLAVEEFSIFTCHAGIPSAPTLMTECQGRSGALVSPALDCCEEFVCATQMYGDSDLSLTSTPLVDERPSILKVKRSLSASCVCTALLHLF